MNCFFTESQYTDIPVISPTPNVHNIIIIHSLIASSYEELSKKQSKILQKRGNGELWAAAVITIMA